MSTTARAGLRIPENTDSPDVVRDLGNLATDADGKLFQAFSCTSSTRPTGIATGFIIFETDTNTVLYWSGSAWASIGSGGGGGGSSYSAVAGQWSSTVAQSIPYNTSTLVSFPTTNLASAIVARTTNGPGHTFTVSEAGVYAIDATVRFASGGSGGNRVLELQDATASTRYGAMGGQGGPGAATLHIQATRRLGVNATVVVVAYQAQTGGSSLNTEPTLGGSPTTGMVQLAITKISA